MQPIAGSRSPKRPLSVNPSSRSPHDIIQQSSEEDCRYGRNINGPRLLASTMTLSRSGSGTSAVLADRGSMIPQPANANDGGLPLPCLRMPSLSGSSGLNAATNNTALTQSKNCKRKY